MLVMCPICLLTIIFGKKKRKTAAEEDEEIDFVNILEDSKGSNPYVIVTGPNYSGVLGEL